MMSDGTLPLPQYPEGEGGGEGAICASEVVKCTLSPTLSLRTGRGSARYGAFEPRIAAHIFTTSTIGATS
jgi:hypothetical protein